ncbi:NACHT domain-containing protein [Amylocystis lapponica]|nr:NACHT domain-containing protein [Amylocystis lapponica]
MEISHRGVCLSNTRQEMIASILDKLLNMESDTAKRVLWLHGPAGSGKSTLATTIANHFVKQHRRGAFVFFDRSRAEASRPKHVIRTIAYQLGLHDPFIQSALVKSVQEAGDIDTLGFNNQFFKLWVDPLCKAQEMHTRPGPIVVVIDALDECGTIEEHKLLLQLLSESIVKLPANYHFFITSRPEADIVDCFSDKLHIKSMSLDIFSDSNKQDVQNYLEYSMSEIQRSRDYLSSEWPGQTAIDALLKRADGLFIWASTANIFISDPNDNPQKQLNIILTSELGEADSSLDSLYETVLQTMKIWKKSSSSVYASWHKVLGLLAPLTDNVIDKILDLKDAQCSHLFFQRLRSLLHWAPGKSVQLLHASIADYLIDRKQCGDKPWFIDTVKHNEDMARSCLHVMQRELHFNVCNLETSYMFNKDVKDLADRIKNHISPQLSYSCQYWTDHLSITLYSPETCDLMVELCSRYLLFWIEVLSLLECPLSPRIKIMSQWSQFCIKHILYGHV